MNYQKIKGNLRGGGGEVINKREVSHNIKELLELNNKLPVCFCHILSEVVLHHVNRLPSHFTHQNIFVCEMSSVQLRSFPGYRFNFTTHFEPRVCFLNLFVIRLQTRDETDV